LKVSANVKIAMQCFEISGGQMPPPPGCAPASTPTFKQYCLIFGIFQLNFENTSMLQQALA